MAQQTPNRLDRAGPEAPILRAALAVACPECGEPPGRWCFRVGGSEWTVHSGRLIEGRQSTPATRRLDRLRVAKDALPAGEWDAFTHALIGALANRISDDDWDQAIANIRSVLP